MIYESLGELLENSIIAYNGMITVWPVLGQEIKVDSVGYEVERGNGKTYYAVSGVIGYILGKNYYITPYTIEASEILQKAGFTRTPMYIPVSNLSYPRDEKEKWNKLLRKAELSRRKEYRRKKREYLENGLDEAFVEKFLRY